MQHKPILLTPKDVPMNFNRHSAFTKVLVVFIREIKFIAPACTGLAWAGRSVGWW